MKDKIIHGLLSYVPEGILRLREPKSINIEVTNACNLRCRTCPIPYIKRKKGMMSLENFKIIFNKLPKSVKFINMTWSGEPLLNRNIFKMITYASERGVKTHVSTNVTNLHTFNQIEIINSKLNSIAVCLDGFKKEHEDFRRGSNFETITENIKKLTNLKKKHRLKTKIFLQTLVKKDNYKHIQQIIEFGKELGVDEIHFRYFSLVGSLRLKNRKDAIEKFIPPEEYSIYMKKNDDIEIKWSTDKCYAFMSQVILWNGDITICCFDAEGEEVFGNLIKEDWKKIHSRLPVKKIMRKKFDICKLCETSSKQNYKKVIF